MMLAGASGSTADNSNRWPGAQRVAWCSAPDGEEGPGCCWQKPTCLNYLHYHYLMAHLFALSAVCIHYYIITGPPVWIIRRSSKQDIWLQQAWKKLLTGGSQAVARCCAIFLLSGQLTLQAVALGSLSSCRLIGEEPSVVSSVVSTRRNRCANLASSCAQVSIAGPTQALTVVNCLLGSKVVWGGRGVTYH